MPAWHPNFRIAETLPDTKVIRTSFVVNAAAAVVFLGLATAFFLREQDVGRVNAEIAELQAETDRLNVPFKKAVPLQKQFSDGEKRLAEFEAFRKAGWPAAKFLEQISKTLPRFIVIEGIDMRKEGVVLRGAIVGAPDRATGAFKEYLGQLGKDEQLALLVENVREQSFGRDQQNNRQVFSIEMKPKLAK